MKVELRDSCSCSWWDVTDSIVLKHSLLFSLNYKKTQQSDTSSATNHLRQVQIDRNCQFDLKFTREMNINQQTFIILTRESTETQIFVNKRFNKQHVQLIKTQHKSVFHFTKTWTTLLLISQKQEVGRKHRSSNIKHNSDCTKTTQNV